MANLNENPGIVQCISHRRMRTVKLVIKLMIYLQSFELCLLLFVTLLIYLPYKNYFILNKIGTLTSTGKCVLG